MKNSRNHEGKWPEKAYKNLAFLSSPDARTTRVLCEFIEPGTRFRRNRIHDPVVFFGSARVSPRDEALRALEDVRASGPAGKKQTPEQRDALARAERTVEMSRYYEEAAELAERMTRWSRSLRGGKRRFIVCSGGGPGIMEAANRGASRAGGPSIGLNISLPFEQMPNPYQSQELAFEFHYFFVRKFWFAYLAKALIVFPGGFGTMDEMFEILTLIQTRKTAKSMPVVLYGGAYWNEVFNFESLVKWGMIDRKDLDLFRIVDDVETAYTHLTSELKRLYVQ